MGGADVSMGSSSALADKAAVTLGLPLALLGRVETAGGTNEELGAVQMEGGRRVFATEGHELQPKAGATFMADAKTTERGPGELTSKIVK